MTMTGAAPLDRAGTTGDSSAPGAPQRERFCLAPVVRADVEGVRRRRVLDVSLAALTRAEVVEICQRAIDEGRRLELGVVNAAKIVNMRKDHALGTAVRSCELILADGQAVVWASRLLGTPVPERVAGIDLFFDLLEGAARRGERVYLLGATEPVVRQAAINAQLRYPGLVIAGYRDGYFSDEEESAVADQIRAARADLLFLGMTSPKKENFIARHGDRTGALVVHGVGGSFDILAGKTTRAPETLQRIGLEWAYRVYQEPRRMWRRYLVTNTKFVSIVAAEMSRVRRSRSVASR